jgi:histidyl-tRNA synthetase
MLKAPRGTSDILPPDTSKWIHLEDVLRHVAARYSYEEVRTPTFEHAELFSRTVGEATDIVEKEMYVFKDKTGRDLALRPEGTAPVARAFVEHGMAHGALPRKFYYICPMFRYEKPQAGRFREHRQFGVEVLGSGSPYSDVEVVLLAADVAKELGLLGTTLTLNSIGCSVCRAVYKKDLTKYLSARLDKLCPDCRSRLNRNPLRVLDCRQGLCREEVAGAPRMLDYLCDDCRTHWDEMTSILIGLGLEYTVDHSLVRGLDYYTRTVFELKWPPLGAQSTLVGGGRYDRLVQDIDGPPTPGVGFGMGMERILLATAKGEKPIPGGSPLDVFVAGGKSETLDLPREVFSLVQELRSRGLSCDFDPLQRSLKAQMKQADRAGAAFVAILGEDEIRGESVTVKSMKEGRQKSIARTEIPAFCEEVRAHAE